MKKPRKRKLRNPKKGQMRQKRNKILVKIKKSKIPVKRKKSMSHNPQTKTSIKQ